MKNGRNLVLLRNLKLLVMLLKQLFYPFTFIFGKFTNTIRSRCNMFLDYSRCENTIEQKNWSTIRT